MKLEKWKNKWKEWSNLRKWQIWKLKLIDARLYFVSIFVGLLTGLVAVPYHYLLWYFFDVRKTFFSFFFLRHIIRGIGMYCCFLSYGGF